MNQEPTSPASDETPCSACEGTGEIPPLDVTPIEPTQPCRECDGNGRIYIAPLTYSRCACDHLPNVKVMAAPLAETTVETEVKP